MTNLTFTIAVSTLFLLGSLIGSPPVAVAREDEPPRLKVGLALAGGGTRGCAHIGVLRELDRAGVKVDIITGTSIGAIVGGLYAGGLSPDRIEELMRSRRILHAYDTVPIPVRVAAIPVFFLPHLLGYHPYDGLYKGTKFAKFITRTVPENHRLIENMPVKFCAVAANLEDGKAYGITNGDIGKAVQASSALPFLRRPVEWQDKLFVDGGIVENLPVERARNLGADLVIAVDIDDDLVDLEKRDFRKIGSTLNRAINMHLSAVDRPQLKFADVVIHPDVSGIKLLSRRMADVRDSIKRGEQATLEKMTEIKERLKEISANGPDRTKNKKPEANG